MGDEEARCRAALDEAAKGQRVALICSGDPQIYAMAQVVYELLARHPEREDWQQIFVETLPGITAMQALAAKVGAPMGHDFCAISLSDLNTPWEAIEKKVQAAAEADFCGRLLQPSQKTRLAVAACAGDFEAAPPRRLPCRLRPQCFPPR